MPHILLESHGDIDTKNPSVKTETNFDFIGKSQYDEKIAVSIDNKEFLLTKVKKNNNDLIKLDNSTRLTPSSLMKTALNDYALVSGAKILFSNTNSIHTNKVKPQIGFLKDIEFFANEFQTDKEILVEVGFGSGTHLLHQAQQNPDKLLIGLEIHYPSIEQVLKQLELQNINNVLIVNYDARLFLEFLNSNSVGKVFVHFPVPWDKKPHRRVMSVGFIQECLRVLKVKGTLELRTDSPNYFEYSSGLLEHFSSYPHKIFKDQDLQVTSKYEARWKKQEKNIWDVIIESTEISPPNDLDENFDFPAIDTIENLKAKIPSKAIIGEEFLVHFESIYDIIDQDSVGLLIKVTFGSFNRPVTKNIYIKNDHGKYFPRYFQGDPIKTKTNLLAHKVILEIIN